MFDEEKLAAFLEFSPSARETYALLNGELIIKIDEKYKVIVPECYGLLKAVMTPLKQRIFQYMLKHSSVFESARLIIQEVICDHQIRSSSVSVFGENKINFTCCPSSLTDSNEKSVFIFAKVHPALLYQGKENSDSESRWLVPGYKLKGNFKSQKGDFYTTNQYGFHDSFFEKTKAENTYRIMCVGGSTTEEGPSVDETYPKLLQKKLRVAFPGKELEVLNAGTPANAAFCHLLRFNEYADFDPDMTILHIGVNDTLFYYDMDDWTFPAEKLRFLGSFFSRLLARDIQHFSRQHYENMGVSLELFIQMALKRNIKVCLASIACPQLQKLNNEEWQYLKYNANTTWEKPLFDLPVYEERIQASNHLLFQLARKYDLPYLAIAENINAGMEFFTDFCHMSPAGIEYKAQVFYEQLLPLLQKEFMAQRQELNYLEGGRFLDGSLKMQFETVSCGVYWQ
ncbi:MAG TPA: SGNH/GDSL hydrolase family protein [Candidatus Hydrogenedentes bacterium]|nr:SGNH/GDSL hydrolase family protein [Candidatus Hydrogenedentota bacterium]HOD95460.1 SGNH/GDSL hydrolase family protein [Candidatus Hydrogenedentota bacterium]HOR50883.1 SGNH/GDSL hydrolase family protein [Candidatus Hydrogenedentota bacterium]HPK25397.1 SGNH/GDSL hydrolase family protein [Candidatus Hydrogenedentota bacterium]